MGKIFDQIMYGLGLMLGVRGAAYFVMSVALGINFFLKINGLMVHANIFALYIGVVVFSLLAVVEAGIRFVKGKWKLGDFL